MFGGKYLDLRKKTVIIIAISIALLFVSSATAVPQVHGSIAVEKIDKATKMETISRILTEESDIDNLKSDEDKINSIFMLATVVEQTIYMLDNPYDAFNLVAVQNAAKKISNDEISKTDVTSKTQTCLDYLYTEINKILTEKELSEDESNIFKNLKGFVSKMQTLLEVEISDNNIVPNNIDNIDDSFFQKLLSILMTILSIAWAIFKGILEGTIALLGGLLNGIGSLVTMILLIFAGIQTFLVMTGFFIIYRGFMSGIGIKVFSAMFAPIFAIISAGLTNAIGSVVGYLSVVFSFVLAALVILAIPLAIIAAVILLLGETEGEDGNDGFLYIMASCVACFLGGN